MKDIRSRYPAGRILKSHIRPIAGYPNDGISSPPQIYTLLYSTVIRKKIFITTTKTSYKTMTVYFIEWIRWDEKKKKYIKYLYIYIYDK